MPNKAYLLVFLHSLKRVRCCSATLGVVVFFIVLNVWMTSWTQYRVHDSDSRLYADLSSDLATLPWYRWCALEWGGHWNRQGWFLEHPPGLFWLVAVGIRLGLTPYVAIYAVNFTSWTISLCTLAYLGRRFESITVSVLAPMIWIICPVFIQYLVRGDQEHPLTCFILLGVLSTLCIRNPWWMSLSFGAALLAATMLKGLPALVLIALAVCIGLWRRAPWVWWLGLLLALAMWSLGCAFFDQWYWRQTHQVFWASYVQGQVAFSVGRHWSWLQKIINLVYYLARPLWFGLPALALGFYGLKRVSYRVIWPRVCFWLGPIISLFFIGAFSLADRKADRYLFPIYPFLSLSAATVAVRIPKIESFLLKKWFHRRFVIWSFGTFLCLCTFLKVYMGTYHYTFIRLWPGDY